MSDRVESMEQLAGTLAYLTKMADFLEGLRQYEEETGEHDFVISGSYPIHELRKNLALAREFAEREIDHPSTNGAAYTNGHTVAAQSKALAGA